MSNTAQNVKIEVFGKQTATPLFDLKLKAKAPHYLKIAEKEVLASEFIPYATHYDENTLLTKSGDLLQILKVEGIPFETVDSDWLMAQKNLRNTLFRSMTSSRYAIYAHTIRKRNFVYPSGEFPQGFSNSLNEAWKQKHTSQPLYTNELYLTILRKNQPKGIVGIKKWLKALSHKRNQKELASDLKLGVQELQAITQQFLTSLKEYGTRLLGIVKTDKGWFSEPAQFLGQLINLEDRPMLIPAMELARYLPTKRLLFGRDALEAQGTICSKLGAILSVKEYADHTAPGILDALLSLPTEFILTQSFVFTDRQSSLSQIQTQQRKMLQTEDLALSQVEQIHEALDDTASGRIGFGHHHLTVLVTGETLKELDQSLSNVESAFLNRGIVTVREDLILEPCFWAQLPGNFPFIARSAMISTANLASFVSLHNYPSGKLEKNHWGSATTVLESFSGTPYFFNFHVRDVGHTVIIGPTGTGKSLLLNFLLAQSMKFKPKIFFFDKDQGAEIFIRAMKGVHSTLSLSDASGLNPLQLPDTPENRTFLTEWLQLLLTAFGEPFTAEDFSRVTAAIVGNYTLKPSERTLENIAPFLGLKTPGSLAARLSMWYGSGNRSSLFGNSKDLLHFDSSLFCFEMGEILEDKMSLPSVLAYLFHRINLELTGEPTIIVLEEGWKLLDNPFFAPKIKDWLQTFRKKNAMVIFLTPNIESAVHSSIGDTLVQQCPTAIFLPNYKATNESYCQAFKLTEREYEIVRTLNPQDHGFLLKHGPDSLVARLDLISLEQFIPILSGTTQNLALLRKIREDKGDNPEDWIPLFREKAKI